MIDLTEFVGPFHDLARFERSDPGAPLDRAPDEKAEGSPHMELNLLFPDPVATPARRLGATEVEEMIERLLAAPFVDASQVPLNHPARPDSGEMRLALAILDDALRCVLRHSRSPLRKQRCEARDARRWIESDDTAYALSFVPICQTFGIDPDWVRGLVRRQVAQSAHRPAIAPPRAALSPRRLDAMAIAERKVA
jgi:hypothetical protein